MHFIFDSNTLVDGASASATPFISISPRGSSSQRREWNATPLSGRFVLHSDKQVERIRFDLVGATTIFPKADKRHLFQTIEVNDVTEHEGLIQVPFIFDVSSVPEDDIFSTILPPPTCSASHFKTTYTLHAYVTWADDSSPRRRFFRRSDSTGHISREITIQYKQDENGTGFYSIDKMNSRAVVESPDNLSIEVPRGIRVNYQDGHFKTMVPDVGRSPVTKLRSDAEQLPVVCVRGAQGKTLRLVLVEETHLLYAEPILKLTEVVWRSEDVHGTDDVTSLALPNGIKVCPDFETGHVKITHALKIESLRTGHPMSVKTQSTRIKVVSEGSVGADAMDEAWSFEVGTIDDPPPAYS